MTAALAPGAALTVAELTWDEALTLGTKAREAGDQARWDLGDVGNIVASKWQHNSLKKFAGEIGIDNHKRLYEYVQVSSYWPKDARADFPTLSWSHWREAARHGLPIDKARDYLTQASDKNWPVAALREAITGNRNEPITRRMTFDCMTVHRSAREMLSVMMDPQDITDLIQALGLDGATLELRVSWQEARCPG